MRAKRFHGLKRLKIRQSWNKFNLYNLSRLKPLFTAPKTFFQQKWLAKSISRGYHGEQIREKAWQRRFTSKIRSVVPMDHRYLAAFDGSEQAQGRGSGKEVEKRERTLPLTPYMQMTYAPMERRLDTAIFRALFASSTRQARQFVIHGAVKVNGKKMIYPGYLLNPGDMFQVEPERVMFATGAPKDARERRATRRIRNKAKESKEGAVEINEDGKEVTGEKILEPGSPPASKAEEADDLDSKRKSSKVDLKDILQKAKSILAEKDKVGGPSAKRKQELRAFTATVRNAIGQVNRKSAKSLEDTVSSLDEELSTLLSSLSVSKSSKSADTGIEMNSDLTHTTTPTETLSEADSKVLREALIEARENPIDPTKPYATPWRPRPYMSAFAFIPKYLEVNQNICAAVYLRHPVARPGLAEVPTPFGEATNQLAFAWYLRRR